MDIAARVDIERLRAIMSDLLIRSAALIRRYGGTVEHTGDGVMAIFGAPAALEDHAYRACLAALAIQDEAGRLAVEVQRADGVTLQLRVGLNSGRVIAGEIGSGPVIGYAATGETVGFAQRMESVAPPGGAMLSESTARIVEPLVVLGEPEWVRIKGAQDPVRGYRLMGIARRDAPVARAEAAMVGRGSELAVLDAVLERARAGHGGVAHVTGPPGVGKSRMAREIADAASRRGVEVFWTFCESHSGDVPFYAVSRLLRAGAGVADLDDHAARAQVRELVPDAESEDVLLLDDLLGIADPDVPVPQIDPDARRRRLTALINAVSLARPDPALHIIEDVHWIDAVSESMLADFLTVIPQSRLMVLITYRPEYRGVLTRTPETQTIKLEPLGDSDTAALIGALVGAGQSVSALAAVIADRAAGNPFFAEEMVRDLVERGVLSGERGNYVCRVDAAEVSVPATVQAAIEARIDRLGAEAKRTVNAASVIGGRFDRQTLEALHLDATLDELLRTEVVDQVGSDEFAFHHPLTRTVAYESQLKSDRAELHRRVAAVIEARDPTAAEENAALIAEHLEAAGDLHDAYGWHMRSATWATNRDIRAARLGWERALQIAGALPTDDPASSAMRIAPRTMLCGTAWRVREQVADGDFNELRQLCAAIRDRASLAISIAGLVMDRLFQDRVPEASRLASEAWELSGSIGDSALTVGLSFPLIYVSGT